jgi:hypothetical protein
MHEEKAMTGKKLLLVLTLLSAGISAASAQGLVGAPVDPRYGQDNTVGSAQTKVTASGAQPAGTGSLILTALITALRIVRL